MLVLNFDALTSESDGSLTLFNFFDTTGVSTATGYGVGGNPSVGSVTMATVTILPYLSTAAPFAVNVYESSVFPNTDGAPFVILNTDLGLTGSAPIISGIYEFTYAVTAASNPYTTTKYIYLDAAHVCCSDKILSKAVEPGCANRLDLQTLAINLQNMIASVHAMLRPNCDQVDSANDIVKQINAICTAQGAGCGCNQ